jgi:catechol 2,3-dioxygenase-like lactoylglutathione lyase family enzyme
MRLKNILIVVDNIEESIRFYNELFGLNVISRQEGNVIMSEGLVLQDAGIWQESM